MPPAGSGEPGFSKERRREPQITIGLLTDAGGFPLVVSAFEGNKAETKTMLPVIQAFMAAHHLPDVTVAAGAGMVSEANQKEIEAAGLSFIPGADPAAQPAGNGQIVSGRSDGRRRAVFTAVDRRDIDAVAVAQVGEQDVVTLAEVVDAGSVQQEQVGPEPGRYLLIHHVGVSQVVGGPLPRLVTRPAAAG